MEKVLITGVAGFIGYALAKRFLEEGYDVVGIDNLDPYYPQDYKKMRLDELLNHGNFRFFHLDFVDKRGLEEVISPEISGILHIGAKAGVRASINDPEAYFKANTIGTLNILNVMVSRGINRILMASTSSIYAGHKPPFVENMKTDTPISPYAVSKKAAENLLYTYHHLYGINACILRYFTVYGPHGRPDMSIFKLFYSAFSGEEFPLYGDGKQRRSFTFIEDVVEATFKAYNRMNGYNIINIGNDKDEELLEIVSIIENLTGRKINLKFQPFHTADLKETRANIEKAKRVLNWEPSTDISLGLEKTYVWFRENWNKIKSIFPSIPRI